MARVVVTKLYHVWYRATVEVDGEGIYDEVKHNDVLNAVEDQQPLFVEVDREFMDTTWDYDWDQE